MPNTMSAEKAVRQSNTRKKHNLMWKSKIKSSVKAVSQLIETKPEDPAILIKSLSTLQKVLDKAAKNKVIHKNKAARLMSRYAKRATVQATKASNKPKVSKTKSSTRGK